MSAKFPRGGGGGGGGAGPFLARSLNRELLIYSFRSVLMFNIVAIAAPLDLRLCVGLSRIFKFGMNRRATWIHVLRFAKSIQFQIPSLTIMAAILKFYKCNFPRNMSDCTESQWVKMGQRGNSE